MRFWVTIIVVVATALPVMTQEQEPVLDDGALHDKYVKEIRELLEQGKSWKEIETIMGIWSSEDEEQTFPEHIEPSGRQSGRQGGSETKNPYDYEPSTSHLVVQEMVDQMYKIAAEGQARFEWVTKNNPPKNTKYTIPIIEYVSNFNEKLLRELKDDP